MFYSTSPKGLSFLILFGLGSVLLTSCPKKAEEPPSVSKTIAIQLKDANSSSTEGLKGIAVKIARGSQELASTSQADANGKIVIDIEIFDGSGRYTLSTQAQTGDNGKYYDGDTKDIIITGDIINQGRATPFEFALTPYPAINITIKDEATKKPLQNVNVEAFDDNNKGIGSKDTDEEGKVSFFRLKSGETYTLKYRKSCFEKPASKSLTPDERQTQENNWTLKAIFMDMQIGDNSNSDLTELDFGDAETVKSFNVKNKGSNSDDEQASCTFDLTVEKSSKNEWLLPMANPGIKVQQGGFASITVKIDRSKLPGIGLHEAKLTLKPSSGLSKELKIKATGASFFRVDQSPISFTASDQVTIQLSRRNTTADLAFKITSLDSWLSTNPNTGTLGGSPELIKVSIDRAQVPPGTSKGNLEIESSDGKTFKLIIPVKLSGGSSSSPNTVTIDGQTYKTVTIGSQTWLAENLNLDVSDSYCYDDKSSNCDTYGRLYEWEAAKAAAAKVPGWHLPTDAEWKTLEMALGMSQSEADDWGWRGSPVGTKLKQGGSSGMDLLLAGYRSSSAHFYDLGSHGHFWSASPLGSSHAWHRYVYSGNSNVSRHNYYRSYAFSVRLVKD